MLLANMAVSNFLLNAIDIKSLNLEYLPEFYHKVLSYWQESKLITGNEEKSVKNKIIWNNQKIVVDGKPIFFRNWVQNKGIVYIKDLLDKDSNFLSLAGLKEKFQINPPFTVYYGLLKVIPKEWKTALYNAPHTGNSSQITFSTKGSFLKLLSKRYLAPTAEQQIISHGFTKENVCNVYLLPFQILKEAKLIMFQYKIIHNILPTQASLFRSNLAENDVCPLLATLKESRCLTCCFLALYPHLGGFSSHAGGKKPLAIT